MKVHVPIISPVLDVGWDAAGGEAASWHPASKNWQPMRYAILQILSAR